MHHQKSKSTSFLKRRNVQEADLVKTCRGLCLEAADREGREFYRSKLCPENCKPVKCKSWLLCGNYGQQHHIDRYEGYCAHCSSNKEPRPIVTRELNKCPVCLEHKVHTFVEWKCEHKLCVDCHRKNLEWKPLVLSEVKVYGFAEWEAKDILPDSSDGITEYPNMANYGKCPICHK